MKPTILALALCVGLSGFAVTGRAAAQDACFDHNGSKMRLVDRGGRFTLFYEEPRDVLRRAGVKRGTVLANGTSTDGGFFGVARRFSRHCRGNPLEYPVTGFFQNEYTMILTGRREVHERCQPTGRYADDTLVFNYIGWC